MQQQLLPAAADAVPCLHPGCAVSGGRRPESAAGRSSSNRWHVSSSWCFSGAGAAALGCTSCQYVLRTSTPEDATLHPLKLQAVYRMRRMSQRQVPPALEAGVQASEACPRGYPPGEEQSLLPELLPLSPRRTTLPSRPLRLPSQSYPHRSSTHQGPRLVLPHTPIIHAVDDCCSAFGRH